MSLIENALVKAQSELTEYEAKRFLAGEGIPVCREIRVADPDAAATEAIRLGFPVALKASGPSLFHKTEAGGVALDLKTEHEVREEGKRLLQISGCDGLLVQEMIKGDREFVCGLIRDNQLGPCVMFGLDGIFTEVFDDAVFRVAPLTPSDAVAMMAEIQSAKILQPFRAELAVDVEALAQILVTLGEVGLRHDAIRAIDINPVKIRADGTPVAVDALISLTCQTSGCR